MANRVIRGLAASFLVLSIVMGISWWAKGWSNGVLREMLDVRPAVFFLAVIAGVQVAGWLLGSIALRRAARTALLGPALICFFSAVILVGNAVFWFTPILGAMVIVVALLGFGATFLVRPGPAGSTLRP